MNRTLLRSGFVLLLIALFTGFAIPFLKSPRLGLSSHMIALVGSLFLVAVGVIWDQIVLGETAKRILLWLWLWIPFANWFGTLLSAVFGGTDLTPIANEGTSAAQFWDVAIKILILPMTLMAIAAVSMTIWGLRGNESIFHDDTN